jgi:hypothetical protein
LHKYFQDVSLYTFHRIETNLWIFRIKQLLIAIGARMINKLSQKKRFGLKSFIWSKVGRSIYLEDGTEIDNEEPDNNFKPVLITDNPALAQQHYTLLAVCSCPREYIP